jgi:hypothetical protein
MVRPIEPLETSKEVADTDERLSKKDIFRRVFTSSEPTDSFPAQVRVHLTRPTSSWLWTDLTDGFEKFPSYCKSGICRKRNNRRFCDEGEKRMVCCLRNDDS